MRIHKPTDFKVAGSSEPKNSFLERIDSLEDKKMELVIQGADVLPHLAMQFQILERKLEKYYRWYASALMAGKV